MSSGFIKSYTNKFFVMAQYRIRERFSYETFEWVRIKYICYGLNIHGVLCKLTEK
jgi:hypothetical protein